MSPEEVYNFMKYKTNNDIAYSLLPYLFTKPPFTAELLHKTHFIRDSIDNDICNQSMTLTGMILTPKFINLTEKKGTPHWIIGWSLNLDRL